MRALDIMTTNVACIAPDATVQDVAKLFLERRISAAPVVDESGSVIGIVSEGDLLRRAELGTEWRRSRWVEFVLPGRQLALEYVKSHASRVRDVMTAPVITADEATPLGDIADLLERRRVKRVPIMRDGKLVGLVSRSDLVRALATLDKAKGGEPAVAGDDRKIRATLLEDLKHRRWAVINPGDIMVHHGVVHLWGYASSEEQRQALRIMAEAVPGVTAVEDHMTDLPLLPVG